MRVEAAQKRGPTANRRANKTPITILCSLDSALCATHPGYGFLNSGAHWPSGRLLVSCMGRSYCRSASLRLLQATTSAPAARDPNAPAKRSIIVSA